MLYMTAQIPASCKAKNTGLELELGEVLHHVDDVLGPSDGEAPGDEVVLHVYHQQCPPGGEDALEPVDGLAPVLKLLQQMLDFILIKIELRHDSLKWICDACDILAQNVLEKDENHNYHRAGFHFDLINFLRCSVARISRLSTEVVIFCATFYFS